MVEETRGLRSSSSIIHHPSLFQTKVARKDKTKAQRRRRLQVLIMYTFSSTCGYCVLLILHILHFHVLHFHVLHFHVLQLGPSFSCPAISCPSFSAPPLWVARENDRNLAGWRHSDNRWVGAPFIHRRHKSSSTTVNVSVSYWNEIRHSASSRRDHHTVLVVSITGFYVKKTAVRTTGCGIKNNPQKTKISRTTGHILLYYSTVNVKVYTIQYNTIIDYSVRNDTDTARALYRRGKCYGKQTAPKEVSLEAAAEDRQWGCRRNVLWQTVPITGAGDRECSIANGGGRWVMATKQSADIVGLGGPQYICHAVSNLLPLERDVIFEWSPKSSH